MTKLSGLALLVCAVATCMPDDIPCDDTMPYDTCPSPLVCVDGHCSDGDEPERVRDVAGEGEGEGEGEGGALASTCAVDGCAGDRKQYCVALEGDGLDGACVPLADTVTECDNAPGMPRDPAANGPAIFFGSWVGEGFESCADDPVGPYPLDISFAWFDAEGDVDWANMDIVVLDGDRTLRRVGTDLDDAVVEGFHGNAFFTVCVETDCPSVGVELRDSAGHASNGICIVRP
jgi:hypothetical protein